MEKMKDICTNIKRNIFLNIVNSLHWLHLVVCFRHIYKELTLGRTSCVIYKPQLLKLRRRLLTHYSIIP
jgi:hypothetical protein